MLAVFKPALVLFLALTLLTGACYPLLVTGIAQAAFPWQANGSLIGGAGQPVDQASAAVGSVLIGQPFIGPGYFWSRPSATTPAYNAAASSGSNLGPLNPDLAKAVVERVAAAKAGSADPSAPVPVDLVTASGSGLDPHISPAAALYQVPRVAAARGLPAALLEELVREHTQGRTIGLLGEPRINVLRLNLALDRLEARHDGQ
jgi:potassium-transporting ATPase KdpC subunit